MCIHRLSICLLVGAALIGGGPRGAQARLGKLLRKPAAALKRVVRKINPAPPMAMVREGQEGIDVVRVGKGREGQMCVVHGPQIKPVVLEDRLRGPAKVEFRDNQGKAVAQLSRYAGTGSLILFNESCIVFGGGGKPASIEQFHGSGTTTTKRFPSLGAALKPLRKAGAIDPVPPAKRPRFLADRSVETDGWATPFRVGDKELDLSDPNQRAGLDGRQRRRAATEIRSFVGFVIQKEGKGIMYGHHGKPLIRMLRVADALDPS